MEIIRLTSAVYEAAVQHAHDVLPAEAVGLLGGPSKGYSTLSIPLPNCVSEYAFLADPYAQFNAERLLVARGLQLLGIYHSHPKGGTQLSALDLSFARKRDCIQVVVALDRPDSLGDQVRAYRIIENVAVEVGLRILD